MQCHGDLMFFLLERVKCLVQKYVEEFYYKCFLNATRILEQKALESFFATFLSSEKITVIT
jgi:hypothetical protein